MSGVLVRAEAAAPVGPHHQEPAAALPELTDPLRARHGPQVPAVASKNLFTKLSFGGVFARRGRRATFCLKKARDTVKAPRMSGFLMHKPGSVFRRGGLPSFIWACRRRQARSTYPPASGGPPVTPAYLVFQLLRFARHPMSPPSPVGSYPTISPITCEPANRNHRLVCFLLHLLYSDKSESFPLGSRMPCAARTFLPFRRRAMDFSQSQNGCKIHRIFCTVKYVG